MQATPKLLIEKTLSAERILIVAHARPDGDTLGSSLAWGHFCGNHNKNYDLFCADAPADYFSYLPGIDRFLSSSENVDFHAYDLIVCLDHGALHQSAVENHLEPICREDCPATVLNIDHHISNNHFGNINFVQPDSSSTCETLYHIFTECEIDIDRQMATCLMTGIITDTGTFTNSATKQSSLDAASDLVRRGAKIPQITDRVIRNKNIPSLNLWGEAFSRLTINKKYGLAYTVVTHRDLEEKKIDREAIGGLINFLVSLNNVKAVMVLMQEDPQTIKGSLRTQRDDVDVSKIASIWGGGGHRKAAGFVVNGALEERDGRWVVV